MAGKKRPTGVAVLAILSAIAGIVCLIGAVVLGGLASEMEEFIEEHEGVVITGAGDGFWVEAVFLAIAAVVAIVGFLALINAYGLWTGKEWAWWVTIILSILGIIGGLLSLPSGIIGIIIDVVIIYYFTRPHVKEFFGRGAPSPPPPPPPP